VPSRNFWSYPPQLIATLLPLLDVYLIVPTSIDDLAHGQHDQQDIYLCVRQICAYASGYIRKQRRWTELRTLAGENSSGERQQSDTANGLRAQL
jgi:hypothetical protein